MTDSGLPLPLTGDASRQHAAAPRVLLVEDDEEHARIIQRSLEGHHSPFGLTVAATVTEARQAMGSSRFDLVISDWHLPDGDGLELLTEGSAIPLLIMTAQGSEQVAVKAIRAGALDYVVKSQSSLADMPRIAEGAIRMWKNLLASKLDQEKLRIADEALREQERSADLLRKSERYLRVLADEMPQIVYTALPSGAVEYSNQQWWEFTAVSREEAGRQDLRPILHPDDVQAYADTSREAVASGRAFEIECRFRNRKTGEYRWHLGRAVPMVGDQGEIEKWVGTFTDIDDHRRLNEELEHRVEERTVALRKSLMETTTLLKEVHHRVKNNLQVICSLLSMQIACSNGDEFSRPLNDAHSRVLAMSLIHEQIYQSDSMADLDFAEYIALLSERLFSGYCTDPSRIRLQLAVEAIQLTMHQAIPCGLILNELISNSLKHAFRDGRAGLIRISLRKLEAGHVELAVADNGVGFRDGFRWDSGSSLGLQVVRTLIRQLRANLVVTGERGATFRFSWELSDGESTRARSHAA